MDNEWKRVCKKKKKLLKRNPWGWIAILKMHQKTEMHQILGWAEFAFTPKPQLCWMEKPHSKSPTQNCTRLILVGLAEVWQENGMSGKRIDWVFNKLWYQLSYTGGWHHHHWLHNTAQRIKMGQKTNLSTDCTISSANLKCVLLKCKNVQKPTIFYIRILLRLKG